MKIQFIVDAKKYFAVDAERLEQVKEGDQVLVTLDLENKKAEFIWYGEGQNPANFPTEKDDFGGVYSMFMTKIDRLDIMENFPIDGEAYAILTDGKRFAFAWGPELPYSEEVPTENVKDGESGIEWFDTEADARAAMNRAVEAWSDVRGGK